MDFTSVLLLILGVLVHQAHTSSVGDSFGTLKIDFHNVNVDVKVWEVAPYQLGTNNESAVVIKCHRKTMTENCTLSYKVSNGRANQTETYCNEKPDRCYIVHTENSTFNATTTEFNCSSTEYEDYQVLLDVTFLYVCFSQSEDQTLTYHPDFTSSLTSPTTTPNSKATKSTDKSVTTTRHQSTTTLQGPQTERQNGTTLNLSIVFGVLFFITLLALIAVIIKCRKIQASQQQQPRISVEPEPQRNENEYESSATILQSHNDMAPSTSSGTNEYVYSSLSKSTSKQNTNDTDYNTMAI